MTIKKSNTKCKGCGGNLEFSPSHSALFCKNCQSVVKINFCSAPPKKAYSDDIKETMEGLKKSSGFIRTELAKRINLRNTPELVFEIDDSMEYGAKIDSILKEILPEEKGK